MSKPRVLYVAYLAPPVGGSRAQRVAAFSQELARRGWLVDLLTIQPGAGYGRLDNSLLQEMSTSVRVIRTSPGFLHSRAFRGGVRKSGNYAPASGGRKMASRLIDSCFLPDRFIDWLPHALRKGRELIAQNDYSVILTSAAPFSGCLVGRALSRRARKPFMIDLGDPWTGRQGTSGVRRWFDRRMEGWVLRRTNSLMVTTEATKRHYGCEFPGFSAEKISVIPNGYWKRDFEDHGESEAATETLSVVYAGTIYGHRVGLNNFLDALARVRERRIELRRGNLELVFLGRDYMDKESRLARFPWVKASGFVDASKACRIMRSASILLLLGSDGGLQIPGKVWNYVGAARPILTIPGQDDEELRSLMAALRRGPVIGNDKNSIERGLEEVIQAIDEGQAGHKYSLGQIDDALWQSRAENVDRLMHEVVENDKR